MLTNVRNIFLCISLIVVALFSLTQDVCSHTLEYTPPYNRARDWDYETWGVAEANHASNEKTGYIAVLADAYAGSCVSEAKQYVFFYVPEDSHVTVTAKIVYIGGKYAVFHGSFAGTKAVWEIDGSHHDKWIDKAFTPEIIAGKVIGILSMAVDGGLISEGTTIAQAIQILDTVNSFNDIRDAMHQLQEAKEAKVEYVKFSFDAKKGGHNIAVGFRAEAAGTVTGQAMGLLLGQVEYIKIEGVKYPNLKIANIATIPKNPLEGTDAKVRVGIINDGEADVNWANLKVTIGEKEFVKKIDNISKNSSESATFDFIVPQESVPVTAYIDATYAVRETDENDNQKTIDLNITKKPDLYVRNIFIKPPNPKIGETVKAYVTVGNKSATTAHDVIVQLKYQDRYVGQWGPGTLKTDEEINIPFDVVIRKLKTNKFEAYVYSDMRDKNENDNSFVTVIESNLPNLFINKCFIEQETQAVSDKPKTVVVEVKNSGDADAQDVEVIRGTDTVGLQVIPLIKRGESKNATFGLSTGVSGNVSVTFRVDPDNKIKESNETDNTKQLELYVAPPAFDWQVLDLTINPPKPNTGDKVTVEAKIKNNSIMAGKIRLGFLVDGKSIKTVWSNSIDAHAQVALGGGQFAWTASSGRHILEVKVLGWKSDTVMDLDASNNTLKKQVSVGVPGGQVEGIDFTVKPGSLTCDMHRHCMATVLNRGTKRSALLIHLKAYQYRHGSLTSNVIDTRTETLDGGQAKIIYLRPINDAKCEIILDPYNSVAEVDETNNKAELIVGEFKPQPQEEPPFYQPQKGELEVTKFLYTEPLTVGEVRNFSFEIRNNAAQTIEDITAVVETFNTDVKKTLPKYGYGWREIKIPYIPAKKPQIGNTRSIDSQYKAVYPGNFRLQITLLVNNNTAAKAYTTFKVKGDQELPSPQSRDLDLAATDIWIDNQTPNVGEVISGGFVVRNDSPVAVKNIEWKVYSDVNEVAAGTISEIGAGDSYTVNASSQADQEGTFTIKAIVDPDNKIPETNENNNTVTKQLTITSESQPLSLPNVDVAVVSVALSNAHIKVGQDTKVQATVKNLGSDTVNAVPVAFLVGDVNFSVQVIDSLPPGGTKTVTATLVGLVGGTYTITVIADRREFIKETNEGNNQRDTTLVVEKLIQFP
jgi:subtilase family serine protease